jgi:sugar lactone lactonase YvrE
MNTSGDSHNKIVRYQGQRVIQEIDKDERGIPIFYKGGCVAFVSENNNGDIVASDTNADTVVVVDRTGKVRFRYGGKPPKFFSRPSEPFSPRQTVTDPVGHIIVADWRKNRLHILGQNGRFLRCVDSGLSRPVGLSVDSEGRLWVGQIESGEVKVIQYMK